MAPGPETITESAGAPPNGAGDTAPEPKGSVRLQQLRERRKEIAKERTLDLVVPGYDGLLLVRYHRIPREELAKFALKAQRGGDKEAVNSNADLLIRCCEAVLYRAGEDADPEPLNEDSGEPTTFSSGTLGDLLGFDEESARDAVYGLFSPEGARVLASDSHAEALIAWQQGKPEQIDQELLGE
jgi:hypothetical protein